MPLYEGIVSAISDKLIAVIDLGAAYTKFGLTGEFAPRCIIRSEVKCQTTGAMRNIMDYRNQQDLYDMLVDFFQTLYFKHALFSPKDRSVIIVESLLCPSVFRDVLAKVLFTYYDISSLLFLPSHLVSLCTLTMDTALVLDVGYTEAIAIPVCHGVPVLRAWQALPLAAHTVHKNLKTKLCETNTGLDIDEKCIEDIKVRSCFVTTMSRSNQFASSNSNKIQPCPPVQYPLKEYGFISVSGLIRETTFDCLFEEDNDYQSLASMTLDAVLKCGVDLRKQLLENILIIGGTAMMPGFKARLRDELYERLHSERYKDKLHVDKLRFLTPPAKDNYTAWLGAAIYGCTEFVATKSLTRDVYLKEKRVPDWPNMLDNQIRNI